MAATTRKSRDKNKTPATPPVKSDAYVGMLSLALLAQIAGAAFLYMEWSSYPEGKVPPKVQDRPTRTAIANPNAPGVDAGGVGEQPKDKDKAPMPPPMVDPKDKDKAMPAPPKDGAGGAGKM